MKKNKLFLFILGILVSISSFFYVRNVNADINDSSLEKNIIPDTYAVYNNELGETHFYYADILKVNGGTAYCIELGAPIDTNIYNSTTDLNISNLPSEVLNYIRLVAYYGYDYNGHQTNNYYFASQELIWEKITGRGVHWVVGLDASANIINVDNEKNVITSLVNNHHKKPSFNDTTVKVAMGDSIVLDDTNGVLSDYELYNANGNEVTLDGNRLTVKANVNNSGNYQIQLVKKQYTSKISLVYYSGDNQKMLSTGYVDPTVATLNLEVVGGKIKLQKLDKDNNSTIAQGEATLVGAIYGIYDVNDNLVDKLTIGDDFTATSKDLPIGKYNVKEITPSLGYTLDKEVYVSEITPKILDIDVKVYEKVIERKIELSKFYASDETGILTPELEIEFGFYNNKGEEVKIVKTNNQGYCSLVLPYGNYVVKQLNATKDHEKVEDFNIVVNDDADEVIRYTLTNAEIKAKLKVLKIDKDTGKIIPRKNFKFKIFDVNKNDYVCQAITYPKVDYVCEYITDETGTFLTPNVLSSGTYKLEEVDQVMDGYIWNKESLEFQIGENSELITDNEYGILFEVKFENKEVKGQVEINKFGEDLILENDSYQYVKNNLSGVVFGVYANEDIYNGIGELQYEKNSLITKITTDENGYGISDELYLGKYYLKELETLEGYVLSQEKYFFELEYKDQYTEIVKVLLEIENYLKKGTLEFSKLDVSTSKPLPNTKIEIYTEDDQLIFTDYTNENGQIIINDLFVGKFYILEKEAPEGYQLNPDKMWFEIKEDGEIVKCTMTDELIVTVPNTGIHEVNYLGIISGCFLILGVGVLTYVVKKKNKK